jgi:hypothetical protein
VCFKYYKICDSVLWLFVFTEVICWPAELVMLYVNMWFLSCRVEVPKIFKHGSFLKWDILCLYNCGLF